MCLRNSTAVPCWPGMSIEKKLARTVHSSVVTCAPCCSWSLLLMFSVIKYIWFHFFENYPFPHHLHKFPVYPRFVAVFCFSCALSGCLIFRAWLRLSSFPSLGFGCLLFPRLAPVVFFSPPRCSVRCFSHLTHTTANIFWPFIPSLVFRTGSLSSWFALVMQPMI